MFYFEEQGEGRILQSCVVGKDKDPFYGSTFSASSNLGIRPQCIYDVTHLSDIEVPSPYSAFLKAHPQVRSSLCVPIKSRSGEVVGSLFYGHTAQGIFSENDQNLIEGLASQAAIAMDNALLFKKAREAILFRDEFLSIASHELKTPLMALKLQIQIMMRQLQKGSLGSFEKTSQMANQQIRRLTGLVEDLLDVSRISSGKLTLHRERVNVTDLIADMLERNRPELETSRYFLNYQPPAPIWGDMDPLRFEQIFNNLLSNAIKYGEGRPIDLKVWASDGDLFLSIRDYGKGISPEDQARIFDRFERVEATVKGISGLGLGLYITKQIVDAYDGWINVSSRVGEGTTFVVQIPLTERSLLT